MPYTSQEQANAAIKHNKWLNLPAIVSEVDTNKMYDADDQIFIYRAVKIEKFDSPELEKCWAIYKKLEDKNPDVGFALRAVANYISAREDDSIMLDDGYWYGVKQEAQSYDWKQIVDHAFFDRPLRANS